MAAGCRPPPEIQRGLQVPSFAAARFALACAIMFGERSTPANFHRGNRCASFNTICPGPVPISIARPQLASALRVEARARRRLSSIGVEVRLRGSGSVGFHLARIVHYLWLRNARQIEKAPSRRY